jgi:putative tRNA adenosine deaminase-associated protein
MTYFTAVLAAPAPPAGGAPSGWRSVDVDLDEVADVDDLADALGDAAQSVDEGALVIAVLEREDEWFALARLSRDGGPGDGVRVFVSDLEAAASSRFADLLADAASSADDADPEASEDGVDDVEDDDGPAREVDEDAQAPGVAGPSWAGDAALLLDVGVGPEELVDTSESNDPATALAVVGERVGFVDLLEALR